MCARVFFACIQYEFVLGEFVLDKFVLGNSWFNIVSEQSWHRCLEMQLILEI